MKARTWLCCCALLTAGGAAAQTPAQAPARTGRSLAPVDPTGYWTAVVTEDWAWRMRTPPKGDYASMPLNAEGKRVADTWTEAQDGSCLAFGAPALMRQPMRLHITWQDDDTLKIETDNGEQTRLLHFAPAPPAGAHTAQGDSHAEWQIADRVTGSGADGGIVSSRLRQAPWAPLKVTTTNLAAGWLRLNGVPYSDGAALTEYFDLVPDGDEQWLIVTTFVDDPKYLTERLMVSSNFKHEASGAKWAPKACKP
jgi:hypothetical protein